MILDNIFLQFQAPQLPIDNCEKFQLRIRSTGTNHKIDQLESSGDRFHRKWRLQAKLILNILSLLCLSLILSRTCLNSTNCQKKHWRRRAEARKMTKLRRTMLLQRSPMGMWMRYYKKMAKKFTRTYFSPEKVKLNRLPQAKEAKFSLLGRS